MSLCKQGEKVPLHPGRRDCQSNLVFSRTDETFPLPSLLTTRRPGIRQFTATCRTFYPGNQLNIHVFLFKQTYQCASSIPDIFRPLHNWHDGLNFKDALLIFRWVNLRKLIPRLRRAIGKEIQALDSTVSHGDFRTWLHGSYSTQYTRPSRMQK